MLLKAIQSVPKASDTNCCKCEAPCDIFNLPVPSFSSSSCLIIYLPHRSGKEEIGGDSRHLISVTEHGGSSASDRELEHNTKI